MNYEVKDTLLIGDQVTLRFRTTVERGDRFLFETPDNPIVPGVEIIGDSMTDTIGTLESGFQLESRVVITSFDSGSYSLPPFRAFRFKQDGTTDTLFFESGPIEVTTIQIDTTSYIPFDVKEQMNYPYTIREALPWAALIFFAVLLGYLINKAIKNLREKKNIFGKPIVVDPPHIVALRKLEQLRTEGLWKSNQKEYFTRLTECLREYLEERYKIQAMEQTSNEILKELSVFKINPATFKELEELFSLSDLVKFAKYSAQESECESSIPSAVRFVHETYMDQMENKDVF